jgi:hypothetical protein
MRIIIYTGLYERVEWFDNIKVQRSTGDYYNDMGMLHTQRLYHLNILVSLMGHFFIPDNTIFFCAYIREDCR